MLRNSKSNRRKGQSIPVYNSRGIKAGIIEGDTLVKHVRYSVHFLRMHHGWAYDDDILEQALKRGVKKVIIIDEERHDTYEASLGDFFSEKGISVLLGYGKQTCLPLRFWKNNSIVEIL